MLSDSRPAIVAEITSLSEAKRILNNSLRHLILEVTQRCNQRCKYCAFSGRYAGNRIHQQLDMSFAVAKMALDLFIKSSAEIEIPTIGFYGGEPILRLDLIKRVVTYILKKDGSRKYRYSLTTNGTLLDVHTLEYLSSKHFHITISLDGPQPIHDRYRVFTNGKGTHSRILENVNRLKKQFPEYFRKYVSFNAVLAPPYDIESVSSFFYGNPLFKDSTGIITFYLVDAYETTFFRDFELEKEQKKIGDELWRIRSRYKNALIDSKYDELHIEKTFYDAAFYNIHRRAMTRLQQTFPPLGTCFPGQRRIFVSTNGQYYMCERVNCNYEIGNIEDGFDYNVILEFFRRFALFFKDCTSCWALRLCKKCFNSIRRGGQFDEKRRAEYCASTLYSIENDLRDYCEIREANPDAFKSIEGMVIV